MSQKTKQKEIIGNYHTGHCWYYLLGNPVPSLKQILYEVKASEYRGYNREDILAAAQKSEPHRSAALRKLRDKYLEGLRSDISRFRCVVFELHQHRKIHGVPENPVCAEDVHVSVSLKLCHIYNGFAHLLCIDELPDQQGELF